MGPAKINPIAVAELNHVAIHVADVARSCRFYREVLGLEELPRPAFDFPGAWFRLGRYQELHLIGDRLEPVISHNRGNHFALRVESIADVTKRFETLGAEHRAAKRRPDGAWQIFIADPDGHVIELCEVPESLRCK